MMKRVLIGITGGISAYKIMTLIRALKQADCAVKVVLTASAQAFITPLSLQAILGESPYLDDLSAVSDNAMDHIALARWPDVILIAPATAHVVGKLAHGLADDLLSTLCLATDKPVVIAPAMNQQMWQHAATQSNIAQLSARGVAIWGPDSGEQACGEVGPGRLLEPLDLFERLRQFLSLSQGQLPLSGLRIVVTAGPTQEAIDPVRYLSNRSSGKMGYALAEAARDLGADVDLISGPVSLSPPAGIRVQAVRSAAQMHQAVMKTVVSADVFIGAAAVADYTCEVIADQKIKKQSDEMVLRLVKTPDILADVVTLAQPGLLTVGFAAETESVLAHGEKKRQCKGVDLLAVNDVSLTDIGFDSDENALTVLGTSEPIVLARASKYDIAVRLLDIVRGCYEKENSN